MVHLFKKAIGAFLIFIVFVCFSLCFNIEIASANNSTHGVDSGASASNELIEKTTDSPIPSSKVLPQGRCLNASPSSPLQMIGVISRQVRTGNIQRGQTQAIVTDTFTVPNEVGFAIPVMEGWGIGYGEADSTFLWRNLQPRGEDHHLGFGYIDLRVDSYAKTQVTVMARIQLADDDGDDPWVGYARYNVLLFKTGACNQSQSS